jgi:hypothetical protein
MTVTTIATGAVALSRTPSTNPSAAARAAQVLDNLVASGGRTPLPQDDVAAQPAPERLTASPLSQLRSISQTVAQTGALIATAQEGLKAIARAIESATSEPAEDVGEASARLAQTVDSIVRTTRFGGEPLLTRESPALSLKNTEGFSSSSLFGEAAASILSPSGAEMLSLAKTKVAQEQVNLQAQQENLQFAASTVEVALQNQEAARAELSAEDFASVSGEEDPASAIVFPQAQTNRLPPAMLELLKS